MARTANPDAKVITWNPKDGSGDVPHGFKVQSKPTTNPADKEGEKVSIFYAGTSDSNAAKRIFDSLSPQGQCRIVNNYLEALTRARYFGGTKAEIDAMIQAATAGKSPEQVRAVLAALLGDSK